MKRILSLSYAEVFQHLGLLAAFVLLVAAHQFVDAHATLTAVLVFLFSLPYVMASVVSRRATFLYATMLLGAVSYFLTCHALGAPGALFPLLSVPLVVCLLVVGHFLRRRLGPELASFPTTVFRAMHITVAVFAAWALMQVGGLMAQPGYMRYVAGLAYLGYACLYLGHSLAGASSIHIYAFSTFLTFGGILTVAAAASFDVCWAPAIVSAAAILGVGTRLHVARECRWSRNFYMSSAGAIVVSLALAIVRLPYLVVDLSLGSLLLWAAYRCLARAVPDVQHAMLAERVVAKCFFYGSLLLGALVVPAVFLLPADPYVACAALVCGFTFAWIAWRRRDQVFGTRSIYSLASVLFVSAGLLGLGRQLPRWFASGWSAAVPLALLFGLGALRACFDKEKGQVIRRALAEAAVFPAFFAWFIPLLQGEFAVALAVSAAAAAILVFEAKRLKEASYGHAAGPVIAGAFVVGTSWLVGHAPAGWIACAVAAAAAGACFLWAGARGRRVIRGAAHLAWLILSVAVVLFARDAGAAHLLYALTSIGATAALMTGLATGEGKRGIAELVVLAVAVLALIGALVQGPFSGLGAAGPGLCLLALSAAYWLAWARRRGTWYVRAATGLLSLGSLLVIFGELSLAVAHLGAGAGVVLVLMALAAAMRRRFPKASDSAVIVGHLTSMVLACAALIECWSQSTWLVPIAGAAFVLIYAFMPGLRKDLGFRSGAWLWLSFVALFCLAAAGGTSYREQLPLAVFLSLIWLAAGYGLKRVATGGWSMSLYISAAVFAGTCGVVSLLAPASEDTWRVFLVNGVAFACLFLILRHDVFVYLLTLSLSLMAYNWMKATSSFFTQDVLFYLIIGAGVVGVFFSLPHLKKLLTRSGSLPMISIFSWRGEFLMAIPVAGLALLVVMAYTLKLTGHPKFCTSCHNMDEYYGSWQHSAHKNVACIDCHYEPGPTAMVEGKLAGLVQVVKYVSHSYSTRPHAMISNGSCMRPGCHAEMDVKKDALLFRGQINFRHDAHLSKRPRGKVLNCVSCHGQTTQGEHIGVTRTTCITCHFHGRDVKSLAAGRCETCHRLPSTAVTFMGQSFDHKKFLEGKTAVRCEHCHSQVTRGDGAVSATRCRSCHLGNELKVTDQEQFHLVHVSKGHFDCLQCHDEIKHGARPADEQLAFGNCNGCHAGERHSVQERMYAGTAIPGLKAMPDPMFKARVACDGCHMDVRSAELGEKPFTRKVAGAKQCADCHGRQKYGEMLADWREDTKDRLEELQAELVKLAKACQSADADVPGAELAKAKALLSAARTRLSYIVSDGSFGAHNYPYVSEALDSVETDIEKGRSLAAGWKKVASRSP